MLAAGYAEAADFEFGDFSYDFILADSGGVSLSVEGFIEGFENSESLVIPETVVYKERTLRVTHIGSAAFSGCSSLTSVYIPCDVGDSSFANCSNLSSVTFGAGTSGMSWFDNNGIFGYCVCEKDGYFYYNYITEVPVDKLKYVFLTVKKHLNSKDILRWGGMKYQSSE